MLYTFYGGRVHIRRSIFRIVCFELLFDLFVHCCWQVVFVSTYFDLNTCCSVTIWFGARYFERVFFSDSKSLMLLLCCLYCALLHMVLHALRIAKCTAINEHTEYVGYMFICEFQSHSVRLFLWFLFIYRTFLFTEVAGKSFVGWETKKKWCSWTNSRSQFFGYRIDAQCMLTIVATRAHSTDTEVKERKIHFTDTLTSAHHEINNTIYLWEFMEFPFCIICARTQTHSLTNRNWQHNKKNSNNNETIFSFLDSLSMDAVQSTPVFAAPMM